MIYSRTKWILEWILSAIEPHCQPSGVNEWLNMIQISITVSVLMWHVNMNTQIVFCFCYIFLAASKSYEVSKGLVNCIFFDKSLYDCEGPLGSVNLFWTLWRSWGLVQKILSPLKPLRALVKCQQSPLWFFRGFVLALLSSLKPIRACFKVKVTDRALWSFRGLGQTILSPRKPERAEFKFKGCLPSALMLYRARYNSSQLSEFSKGLGQG